MTKKQQQTASGMLPGTADDQELILQFVSMFVHDLEGPLASLKTVFRLVQRGRLDPKKADHQRLLEATGIALDRAEAIVYDLLTATRSGNSAIDLNIETVDIKAVIEESATMVLPAAAENGVAILTSAVTATSPVRADHLMLNRVMDNLLYNALRHTPRGGKILVSSRQIDQRVEVCIDDTGAGLGDLDPEALFSPFKQANFRAQGLHRGVGIGLYLCRQAIEAMNGAIIAEAAPSGGARFRFTIPCGR